MALFACGDAFSVFEQVQQRAVVVLAGDNDHIFEVFRRSPDQGNPPDVNLLDDLLVRSALRNGGLKGVEVNNDEVDMRQLVLLHVGHVFGQVAAVQDPSKHLGVQGLHPTTQNGRVIRDRFNRNDLSSHRLHRFLRSTGGVDGHAEALELLDDGLQTFFVKDGN